MITFSLNETKSMFIHDNIFQSLIRFTQLFALLQLQQLVRLKMPTQTMQLKTQLNQNHYISSKSPHLVCVEVEINKVKYMSLFYLFYSSLKATALKQGFTKDCYSESLVQ